MKRVFAVVVVAALVALALWIVATQQQPAATPVADPGIPAVGNDISAPADAQEMTVIDITDGDTLRLRDAGGGTENVRLVGIDTPEVYPQY